MLKPSSIKPGQGVAVFALPIPVSGFPLITDAIERIYGTGESMMQFNDTSIQINAPEGGFGPVKRTRRKAPEVEPGDARVMQHRVEDGRVSVTLEESEATVLAISETVRLWFDVIGGINYVEMRLQDRNTDAEFIYTVQSTAGKTPRALRLEAEAERDAALAELAQLRATITNEKDNH
jgi:hypothetical protein